MKPKTEKIPFQVKLNESLMRHYNRIAIEYGDQRVSYAQLEHKAAAVAGWISTSRIEPGSFIGLCLDNRVDLIAAVIGILNARCVFVILDGSLPVKRLETMMETTGLRYLLTDPLNREKLTPHEAGRETAGETLTGLVTEGFYRDYEGVASGINAGCTDWDREDEIYIYFTSGSTGTPKAIVGKNKSLLHFIRWEIENFGINEQFRFSQLITPGFDAFLRDIFTPLLSGGSICIPHRGEILMDGGQLAAWLNEQDITLVHCVPSVFRLFSNNGLGPSGFKALKYVLLSGEPVPPNLVKHWYGLFGHRIRLINLYGPTETTMTRTCYFIAPEDGEKARVPAGQPIRGSRILVLDEQLKLCADQQVGEIYIRTPFGTYGYYNDADANEEKFIVNPFNNDANDLLFRSGDLGRVLKDGNLEVLGRIDRQVKIRGVRVEPEEIELFLLRHPSLEAAAVVDRKDREGELYLCAYVVPREEMADVSAARLAEFLEPDFPDYMIPRYFVALESLPLTASGKVDRNALPEPRMEVSQDYVAPENETQETLVRIWSGVLAIDKAVIGIDDNFFRLGGHSLKATFMVEQVHKRLNVKVSLADAFEYRTIRALDRYINGLSEDRFVAIQPVEECDYYPLSSGQKRMYILQQVDLASTVYNMTQFFPLPGEPDVENLERCFRILIQRHESLRTSFELVDDEPVQRVHPGARFNLGIVEADELRVRPFDLTRPPLLRVELTRLPGGQHVLMVDMHHIISDGVSLHLLGRDMMNLYAGQESEPLKIRYKDYSAWQNSEKGRENIKKQELFWQTQLDGEIPILDIPIDYPRPEVQDFEGAALNFVIGSRETAGLKQIALEGNATLYMVLLAIYNMFLAKLCRQQEIIVGAPIAGRRHADLERVIGMFVNTLVLRNYPGENLTFGQFLDHLKQIAIGAFENQDYPFEDLVESVAVKRDAGRNPLFDVVYILQNMGDIPVESSGPGNESDAGAENLVHRGTRSTAKFDLTLMLAEQPQSMAAMFQYSTRLFKEETIRRFIAFFKHVVTVVVKDPGVMLADVELISPEEKQRILTEFNRTESAYPHDKTIHELFEDQAGHYPDRVALRGFNRSNGSNGTYWTYMSYTQLNSRANLLAGQLRQKGAGPGIIIALKMERSVEMIISIMAILKSGGAYLPIETGFPRDRIDYMLNDSAASLLLDTEGLHSLAGGPLAGETTDASDLAYVIYTSGSTGRPKGVLTMHYNVTRVVRNTNYIQLDEGDRVLQLSNYAFDGSVFDIYGALLNGGALVLAPHGQGADVHRLSTLIRREAVNVFFVTTALFNLIVDEAPEILLYIRKVLFGGERVSVSHARRALEYAGAGKIVHMYGPTETTVYASFHPIDSVEDNALTIPIGGPLSNTSIYILDNRMNPVPIGISGELYIGGPGLARGYLNHPELTAERFINSDSQPPNQSSRLKSSTAVESPLERAPLRGEPIGSGSMPARSGGVCSNVNPTSRSIYKTGDLGRWLPDGSIQFLGRVDFQVKVRGFRIELGEIESELLKRDDIKEAVVEAYSTDSTGSTGSGDKYLCVYIVANDSSDSNDSEPSSQELKLYLSRTLPDYMIPSFFIFLERLPLTANGKLDRSCLPKPEAGTDEEEYHAPRTVVEKELAKIWSQILGVELSRVGIDSGFFQLGGHSLKATVMISRVHRVLNVRLPLAEVFRTPTIRELAEYIGGLQKDAFAAVPATEKREYYPLSSAQKRLYILNGIQPNGTGYNIPYAVTLQGEINLDELETLFRRLIQRHDSLRTSFHMINGRPIQRVHDNVAFKIVDSGRIGSDGSGGSGGSIGGLSGLIRPFDLSKAPLVRVLTGMLDDSTRLLLVDMHHIISDGTSMEVLAAEFMRLATGMSLPPLRLQYRDYSQWQNSPRQRQALQEQENYWLSRFEGEIPILDLPLDYPRPPMRSLEGASLTRRLSGEDAIWLKKLAESSGATLYMVLLSLYTLLLSKISGQQDIPVGTPVAARRHADLEPIIGMFVNTLVLRNQVPDGKTFPQYLEEVKARTLEDFENQEYQFEDLVDLLDIPRDTSRNPLFDAFFSLPNMGSTPPQQPSQPQTGQEEQAGLVIKPYGPQPDTSKFDLGMTCVESPAAVSVTFNYCTRLFKEETIIRLWDYFRNIIAALRRNENICLGDIRIISDAERRQVLYEFNDSRVDYPSDKTLHRLFTESAARTPGAIALSGPSISFNRSNRSNRSNRTYLSYQELDRRSDQFAHSLREKGVGLDTIVAVKLERSVEMVTALLAILKAGGAYLPISTNHPQERVDYILKDSNSGTLITANGSQLALTQSPLERAPRHGEPIGVCPKDGIPVGSGKVFPHNLAYVIYTSGTTGRPKGVLIEHRGAVNVVVNYGRAYGLKPGVRLLNLSDYSFDGSVDQIFGTLLRGAQLYLIPGELLTDLDALREFIDIHGIEIINFIPMMLNQLLSFSPKLASLKSIVCGAEKLSDTVKDNLLAKGYRVYNHYGPTEASIDSLTSQCRRDEPVHLGKPVPNMHCYILDRNLQLQPMGVPGEIYVSGHGLARGYLNNPQLTAEKFIPFPFTGTQSFSNEESPLERGDIGTSSMLARSGGVCPNGNRMAGCLYKTGDRGRWLPGGNVEYLGRIDQQVKIRGFRIEPEEIRWHILRFPAIDEAVVVSVKGQSGEPYLAAYYVPANVTPGPTTPGHKEITAHLRGVLPEYMIPSKYILLEEMPLTPGGKPDLKALPAPAMVDEDFVAPRNPVEEELVDIWSQLLEVEAGRIGIDTNFFTLGGHSLKATMMASAIHGRMDVNVTLAGIFRDPTIRGLANLIETNAPELFTAIQPCEEREYYPQSSAQKRLFILHRMAGGGMAYNMPQTYPLPGNFEIHKLESVFMQLIGRHDSLRTSFFMVAEEAVQRVLPMQEIKFTVEHADLTHLSGQPPEEAEINKSLRQLRSNFIRPFDLSRAPLIRACLVSLADTHSMLMVDMHHIITDGTSQHILDREVMALYSGESLPPLRLQYKDYTLWLDSPEQKNRLNQQESFWLDRLSGELPVLNLPTDYPRPSIQSFEGRRVRYWLDNAETEILKDVCRQNEATLYMTLLTVFNILFQHLGGQSDIIIGTPIAARRHKDLEHIVGMLVNTIVLRNSPEPGKRVRGFLAEVKQHTIDAYDNQEYQFEDLVDLIAPDRDISRNPVFDVMLNLLNERDLDGVRAPAKELINETPEHVEATSRFDMAISATEVGGCISLTVEYGSRLFKEQTIDGFIAYLKNIIAALPSALDREIRYIEIITEEEKQRVLEFSNGPEEYIIGPQTIHQWFERQAERLPAQTALRGPYENAGDDWSYYYLNRRANQLAHLLRQKGVGRDSVVAVKIERSKELIAALLAVLKAGGAYLPLDPEYPADRVLTMLEDSGARVLLTKRDVLGAFPVTSLQGLVPNTKNLVVTPRRAQIRDLDGIPIPDRTLIDYEKYHQYIGEAPARHTITMQATRGCPYNCLYCHKIWPKTHITRSAEHIFDEIKTSYDAGIRRFVFIDDIFNLKEKNARLMLEKIIAANLDIQLFFPNGFRGDILEKDFIDLMVEAGTVNVDVALESASPRIQKLIKKNLNLDKFKENVQYLAGKYPHVVLEMEMMHGFPSETEEEAAMTLEFLKEIEWVHFPNLHVLKIYPNTDMYRLALDSGITPASIQRSADMAYHQLPDTLPFAKSFSRQFQAQFMRDYFLLKERLLQVLPNQLKVLSESELVQKYDSYLPMEITCFDDILKYTGIEREELGETRLISDDFYAARRYGEEIRRFFPPKEETGEAFRVLLLDLSLLFSDHNETMLHNQIEEPLGLLYLMTYLNEHFKEKISGKVFKSRIDFDGYEELKRLINDFKPHLIGIRTLSFYKDFFHRTVMMMRQWGVDVPVISGGPYATSDYSLILQDHNVDLVVLGEGELVLAELIQKMMDHQYKLPGDDVLKTVHGLAFVPQQEKAAVRGLNRDILVLDEMEHSLSAQPESNPEPVNSSRDMLYVIYTSGSTGKPKGVVLEHRNLVNLLQYQYNHTAIDFSRVLQFTTVSFDVSFQEIFSTLAAGGSLSLVSKATINDVPGLFEVIEKEGIKTVFMPASYLKFIINEADYRTLLPKGLDHIVTAGEQIVVNQTFRRYLQENNISLHNHYGPSETHVVTALTLNPSKPGQEIPELPPIGKPLANTSIFILNSAMNLQPPGIPGNLYIGGIQVGRGYLNNPELSAEKFTSSPFTLHSSPLYDTGDLSRWLEDGNIQFLGRADHQVKIRGFRVELGEIESRLLEHPAVRDAVVLALTDQIGANSLCAYVVGSAGEEPDTAELRDYLQTELPDYMVPSYIMALDEIPLTPNRKVDRRALPSPGISAGDNYIPPSTPMEILLTEIWADVLGIEKRVLGIEDNFFRLGGHSLKATVLTAKIHKQLSVKVALTEIFQRPTIKALAQHLEDSSRTRYAAIEPVEKKEYYPLSSAQKRLYVLQRMEPESTTYNMPKPIPLSQMPGKDLIENALNRLIARHESLRTSYIEVAGQPVQRVHDHLEFNIGPIGPIGPIHTLIKPFDLSRAPLIRVQLFESMLFIDMHHIITDEVSQGIMEREFAALFAAKELAPLPIQYKDYACWQNLRPQRENIKRQESWWLEQFSGFTASPGIPTDFPRSPGAGFEGRTLSCYIHGALYERVKALCLEMNVTLMMFLLSVYDILLNRYSGRQDVVVGTVAAGRPHDDLQHIIGFFVNMLPLQTPVTAEKSFSQFIADVKETALNAFENQDYPFEELVDSLGIQRQPGRQPLIETVFVFRDDSHLPHRDIPGDITDNEDSSGEIQIRSSHFDLMLHTTDIGNGVRMVFEYPASLFKKDTIKELAGFFKEILEQVCGNPGLPLSEIALSHGLKATKTTVIMDDDDDWL